MVSNSGLPRFQCFGNEITNLKQQHTNIVDNSNIFTPKVINICTIHFYRLKIVVLLVIGGSKKCSLVVNIFLFRGVYERFSEIILAKKA